MNKKRRNADMLIPTIIMGLLAIILIFIGYLKGQHIEGIKSALNMTIQILPILLFSFIVASMVQLLIPREVLTNLVGKESGLRGIFIGTIAGAFSPGGPYISLPIVAALLRAGASIGTSVAFLTGWSLWAVSRLPMEVGILGWRFTLIRLISVFFFPPIAGLIAQALTK
ncbi:MAG: permease [Candidatus Omnitrophota bacterium]